MFLTNEVYWWIEYSDYEKRHYFMFLVNIPTSRKHSVDSIFMIWKVISTAQQILVTSVKRSVQPIPNVTALLAVNYFRKKNPS